MEAPEQLHVPERPKPHRSWIDIAFSVSAMFVSVVSLIAAFQHGQAMEQLVATNARQASASVWPFLELQNTVNRGPGSSYAASIQNNGVGPARVHSYEILVDGRPVTGLDELMARCCDAEAPASYVMQTNSSVSERVLPAGGAITAFRIGAPPGREAEFAAVVDRLLSGFGTDRVETRACYCSVFDECRIVSDRAPSTEPIAACPDAVRFI